MSDSAQEHSSTRFPAVARPAIHHLTPSKIRAVANAAIGRDNVLPFWFGEPDEVTPQFIRDAAAASMASGETFYSHNYGIQPLREALCAYLSSLHSPCGFGNVALTSSGVSALMLIGQALYSPGDRVVCVTPLWPNITQIPKVMGVEPVRVGLEFDDTAGWRLDLQKLLDALTPGTRAVLINSPNNPTGWTMTRAEQQTVLDHCRKHGIWIISDDAYARLSFDDTPKYAAPSFFDLCSYEERVVSASTFSKSWLMTGWRMGWIAGPSAFIHDIGKLIEYNTSCIPVFVQRAGIAALTQGDHVIAHTRARMMRARDVLAAHLATIPGVVAPAAPGAMYAFFRIAGLTDSVALAKRLVEEAGLGLAPGAAFGPEGEGFLRWCFAAEDDKLADGADRLRRYLAVNPVA